MLEYIVNTPEVSQSVRDGALLFHLLQDRINETVIKLRHSSSANQLSRTCHVTKDCDDVMQHNH